MPGFSCKPSPTSFSSVGSLLFFQSCFLKCQLCDGKQKMKKIPDSMLRVSEPNPAWFGNPANEPNNPAWTNKNWLKSRFHFSFAEYNNPHNTGYGILRVLNDDLVQPNRGFGEHPHRNMEICTYIVEGNLTHKDSTGTRETIGRGGIQFMTAGSGVTHSEHNLDTQKPLRFMQIWITPRTSGLPPKYGSYFGDEASRLNKWAHLVSDVKAGGAGTPIQINQDANIFVTEVDASAGGGAGAALEIRAGRQAYLVCMEGAAAVAGAHGETAMARHDAAEVAGPTTLLVRPAAGAATAHMLAIEMAFTGNGRTDL